MADLKELMCARIEADVGDWLKIKPPIRGRVLQRAGIKRHSNDRAACLA